MNYDIINKIKLKLYMNGLPIYSDEIDNIIIIGSTGGEITFMIGKYLSDLIKDKKINLVIGNDVSRFIDYAKSIGIQIR